MLRFHAVLLMVILFAPTSHSVLLGESSSLLPHVILTWNNPDTSSTMTINFQSQGNLVAPVVHYDMHPERPGKPYSYLATDVQSFKISGVASRSYHTVTLKKLSPGETYYFRIAASNVSSSKEYHFQTLPLESDRISFIQGGDMGTSSVVARMGLEAIKRDPSVILFGGDLAYANGSTKNFSRWDKWFKRINAFHKPLNGRLIPVIVAIGNHERNNTYVDWLKRAPFYFRTFNQGPSPYFVRKLGSSVDLYILDSGHITSHGGDQKLWLQDIMKRRQQATFRMAMYHVPLYPSHRSEYGSNSKAGRKHWGPIFDQFKLDVAFENHDHTMKRTYPLKAGKIDSSGTVFVGDGCWGRGVRDLSDRWYLAKSAEANHVWNVEIESAELKLTAIDLQGRQLDYFSISKK